jgi:hypothetical protein
VAAAKTRFVSAVEVRDGLVAQDDHPADTRPAVAALNQE